MLALGDGRLTVDGTPSHLLAADLSALAARLEAHRVQQLVLRQFTPAAEVLKLAQLLASDGELPADSRTLWHVEISVGQPQGKETNPTPAVAGTSEVAALLEQAKDGASPDASGAIARLIQVAEKAGERGAATCVPSVLTGLTGLERSTRDDAAKAAFTKAVETLSTPMLLRQVAQLLPTLSAQRETVLRVLARARDEGARALIAHLMAAETLEERRIFFDAIVELRAGVPQLIDALGHPQWYIVRNAASLLGEMGAREADAAIAALLQHTDERVRKAAAAALTKLDTPAAINALRQVIGDKSPEVRRHAASAYSSQRAASTNSSRSLALALDNEADGDVQLEIIAALGRLGTPDAVQKLIKAIFPAESSNRPVELRVAAAEALIQARGKAALSTLRPLLQDSDHGVRETAKQLIGRMAV
jgi:HEAT repeat protein